MALEELPNPSIDTSSRAAVGPRANRSLLLVDETVHELSARGRKHLLQRLSSGQPLAPGELAQYAKPLGQVTKLETLLLDATKEQPASRSKVSGRRGRQPTTGRFGSRAELLERIWFFKQYTGLSDNAIADNVKVSPGVVAKILLAQEGKPEEAASPVAAGTRQSHGRHP